MFFGRGVRGLRSRWRRHCKIGRQNGPLRFAENLEWTQDSLVGLGRRIINRFGRGYWCWATFCTPCFRFRLTSQDMADFLDFRRLLDQRYPRFWRGWWTSIHSAPSYSVPDDHLRGGKLLSAFFTIRGEEQT